MSGKAGDQDASPPTISTSEITTAKRLTSEWVAGVMRLPEDTTNITSKDLLQAYVNVHTHHHGPPDRRRYLHRR